MFARFIPTEREISTTVTKVLVHGFKHESQLRSPCSSSPHATALMLIDEERELLHVNTTACRALGCSSLNIRTETHTHSNIACNGVMKIDNVKLLEADCIARNPWILGLAEYTKMSSVQVYARETRRNIESVLSRAAASSLESKKREDGKSARPNIVLLLFDSVSRSIAMNTMKQFTQFLAELRCDANDTNHSGEDNHLSEGTKQRKRFKSFVFNRMHAIGENTHPNMIPMFAGASFQRTLVKWHKLPYKSIHEDAFIWKQAKKASSYLNLFATSFEGKLLSTDGFKEHFIEKGVFDLVAPDPMRGAWMAVQANVLWNQIRGSPDANKLCIADKTIDDHIMHYMSRTLLALSSQQEQKKSQPHPFFAFLEMIGSHSPLHESATITNDAPLMEFLGKMMNSSFADNTIFIVFGDHGVNGSGLRRSDLGFVDHFFPFMSMIVPRRLAGTVVNFEALEQNQDRLVVPGDFYRTLQALVGASGEDLPPKKRISDEFRNKDNDRAVWYDLSHDIVPASRTCSSAAIPLSLCRCAPREQQERSDSLTSIFGKHSQQAIADRIGAQLELEINKRGHDVSPTTCVKWQHKGTRITNTMVDDGTVVLVTQTDYVAKSLSVTFEVTAEFKRHLSDAGGNGEIIFETLSLSTLQQVTSYERFRRCIPQEWIGKLDPEFCACVL